MRNNGIADFAKPTILFGQNYGTKTTVEIDHSDVTLDELFDAFETILTGMGFHKDGIKNHIIDLADEYKEMDEENRQSILKDAEWNEEMENQFWREQPPFPFATDVELEQLSAEDAEKLFDVIENPPPPNDELKEALINYDNYTKNKPKKKNK